MLGEMEDPYITSSKIHTDDAECLDWLKWPDVEYGDIFNYCITSPNGYSQEELKAYKSLDAYKFFVDGWVSDILVWVVPSQPKACVVTGRVRHSQKMLDDPLQPWVAVEKKGLVICAHCTCTAGLGEACSHVAALLFLLEANSQMKKSLSCTSQPCYWLPPSFKNVPYAEVCDVDFTSAPKKLKKLTSQTTCTSNAQSSSLAKTTVSQTSSLAKQPACTTVSQSSSLAKTTVSQTSSLAKQAMCTTVSPLSLAKKSIAPSASELHSFFSALSEVGKPAILSIIPEFCEAYVPLRSTGAVPPPLSDLYKEEFLSLSYPDLLKECEEAFVNLSVEPHQAAVVEEKTREQSNSKTWFQQRAGRITASRFKSAAHTDITQPSQSLIKTICYPESYRFTSKATLWGCTHEKDALAAYKRQEQGLHSNLQVVQCGLVL